MNPTSTYDELQNHIRELKTPSIETWVNQYSDKDYTIEITNLEFSAICPKTGLPDYATICIKYVPDKDCVELKIIKRIFRVLSGCGYFP